MVKLEERIAYWSDFGVTNYKNLFEFQERLAQFRLQNKIPDVIIFSEHYPVISFGATNTHNKFNPDFLKKIKEEYGNDKEETVIKYLKDHKIDFFKASRGGGATYIGQGQLLTYPIVDFVKIVKKDFGVSEYKSLIDKIMYEVLKYDFNLNVNIFEVAKELKEENSDMRKDRKDVWLILDGKNYKIGAKGIHTTKNIAYHGFSIYVKKDSLKGFDLILACGYDKNELDVNCIESQLSKKIKMNDVKEKILKKLKEKFGYKNLIYKNPEELERLVD